MVLHIIHGSSCKIVSLGFSDGVNTPFVLDSADAFLFHTPFCKLVQKSLARLMLNDFLSDPDPDFNGKYSGMEGFR